MVAKSLEKASANECFYPFNSRGIKGYHATRNRNRQIRKPPVYSIKGLENRFTDNPDWQKKQFCR